MIEILKKAEKYIVTALPDIAFRIKRREYRMIMLHAIFPDVDLVLDLELPPAEMDDMGGPDLVSYLDLRHRSDSMMIENSTISLDFPEAGLQTIVDDIRHALTNPFYAISVNANEAVAKYLLNLLKRTDSKKAFLDLLGRIWYHDISSLRAGRDADVSVESRMRDIWRMSAKRGITIQDIDRLHRRVIKLIECAQAFS